MKRPLYNYQKRQGSIVANSFNGNNRYDCFKGYIERLEFSVNHGDICNDACKLQAFEAGMATLTAFYATGADETSVKFQEVTAFIQAHKNEPYIQAQMKKKTSQIIKSATLHKLYAKCSALSKKVLNLF